MSDARPATADTDRPGLPPEGSANVAGGRIILGLATGATLIYGALALAGDLRDHLAVYLALHGLLVAAMVLAWRASQRGHRSLRYALVAALAFRLVAAVGDPALSDDVYRYVWDGRVQLHGVHPYAHAPSDPELQSLRDGSWKRINHPELRTIYPPLAQVAFFLLAASGCGPVGFKLALGLADFGVVIALGLLLRGLALPRERVILYAWNPLAVMETAGSGHVEPLGVALLVLAIAWLGRGRRLASAISLASAIHVKLLPIVLLPAWLRRSTLPAAAALVVALVLPVAAYAFFGPAVGSGLFAYAERWEHNAVAYAGVESILQRIDTAARLKPLIGSLRQSLDGWPVPWDFLYRHVWPRDLARLAVALAALGFIAALGLGPRRPASAEWILGAGAVLLLSPTLHPWYVLWLLPFAAAHLSWGWLAFASTVPLAYLGGEADVSWVVKGIEYLPPLAIAALTWWYRWRGRRAGEGVC